MTIESPHELYFDWLRKRVSVTNNPNPKRRYHLLLEQLINIPYRWSIPNDDNRASDGLDLRLSFSSEEGVDHRYISWDVSVLEVLIALCERMSFDTDEGVDVWFWTLMENLDLRRFNDEVYEDYIDTPSSVQERVDTFLDRAYLPNGMGGLFPLEDPEEDQREIEIWYQMSAYLLERVL